MRGENAQPGLGGVTVVRGGLIVLVTAGIALAIVLHAPMLNGPWYWKWGWRQLPALQTIAVTFLCAVPLLVAQSAFHRRKINVFGALFLASTSMLLLQFVLSGMNTASFDMSRIWKIIVDPATTSYFADAGRLTEHEAILESYPSLLQTQLRFHSVTKPPGPVLFHLMMIRWFGFNPAAALAGAFGIAFLAGCCIPSVYFFCRTLGAGSSAAFYSSSIFVLCTGPVVFFPFFDQLYAGLTCLLLGTWITAINRDKIVFSMLCGLLWALAMFFAFHLALLVVFIVGSVFVVFDANRTLGTLRRVAKHGVVVVLVFVSSYIVLWWWKGFHLLETFAAAVANQEQLKQQFAAHGARFYPQSIVPDVFDFALGVSWLPFFVAIVALALLHRRLGGSVPVVAYAWLCLLQIAFVVLSGQLIAETARVLIFLIPLLLFPIGLELKEWTQSERLLFLCSMTLLLALNFQNMNFVSSELAAFECLRL